MKCLLMFELKVIDISSDNYFRKFGCFANEVGNFLDEKPALTDFQVVSPSAMTFRNCSLQLFIPKFAAALRAIKKKLPIADGKPSTAMVYLTRRERFNAAHKLWVDEWSEEKNFEWFGKCANRNWHGHNYDLFVTVKGQPDPVTGFVMDVKDLSQLIKQHVIEHVDHCNLNLDVPFIPKGMQPTTENLAILFWKRLEPHIKNCQLHCIKLWETENIYVEYFGE